MLIKDGNRRRNFRTIWMEKGGIVRMIDQTRLPHHFRIFESGSHMQTADAIRNMTVRGAPAIGAAAAYGMAQGVSEYGGEDMSGFRKHTASVGKTLASTRPTAYDLFHAIAYMRDALSGADSVEEAKETAYTSSMKYAAESAEKCRRIGIFGENLIKDGCNILTHCNAGALACVDYGTALSPIRFAHYSGKHIHVFVDETRPRLQGAQLTAWELKQEGIPFSVIADNAAGFFMQSGEVDLVIVGADRIVLNGDFANKIGTYEKAVLAKENGVPFYVAAPLNTFDFKCKTGREIKIEERSPDEVNYVQGKRITPEDSKARNPAFDVTPAKYVRGIITEYGVIRKPGELRRFLPKRKN